MVDSIYQSQEHSILGVLSSAITMRHCILTVKPNVIWFHIYNWETYIRFRADEINVWGMR